MFDFVIGLPVHALVVHAVVVFGPLTALVALAYAARPGWRRVLGWPLATGAVITGATAHVAAESGERLYARLSAARASTTDFALVDAHEQWGERARLVSLVFMVVVLATVWYARTPEEDDARRHPLEVLLVVVMSLAAAATFVTVALAGHAGSTAVWTGLG